MSSQLAVSAGLRAGAAAARPGAARPTRYVQSVMRYLGTGYTLQREAAAEPLPARELPVQGQSRLLPAVRRRDGAAAADGRRARARRRRVHPGRLRPQPTLSGSSSDLDAHAWVEVWFPHYGWVRFDPTPAAAPARGGRQLPIAASSCRGARHGRRRRHRDAGRPPPRTHAGSRSVTPAGPLDGSALPLVARRAIAAVAARRARRCVAGPPRRAARSSSLAELERALARCGRPLPRRHAGRARASLPPARPTPPATSARCGWRASRGAGRPPTAPQRRALRASCAPASARSDGCARCGHCRRARHPGPSRTARVLN